MNWLVKIVLLVSTSISFNLKAQNTKVANIAVFAPLYLDSTFGAKGYKHGKTIPNFAVAGVEYYYGAKKAMDSLNAEGVKCNYYVFDSKSILKPISTLIANGELANMDLLIGSLSGVDVKTLAEYAKKMNVPFVSATYPNDATVTNNPNFLVLNPTLSTVCNKLAFFVHEKIKEQRIVFFTKPGKQEERIMQYYKQNDSILGGTNIEYIDLGANVAESTIEMFLDSTVLATYIVGSTDVEFAKTIAKTLVKNRLQEQSNLIGLPTWNDADVFDHKMYKDLFFYYVAPLPTATNAYATRIGNQFKNKYGVNPGDNVFRGFESIYKYTKLLTKYTAAELVTQLSTNDYNAILQYTTCKVE
jgi:hypothetical protein